MDGAGRGRNRVEPAQDPTLPLALAHFAPSYRKGPVDECGVFGIYNNTSAAHLTYLGLYALQHRGQESAGIIATDGQEMYSHRNMGLVSEVFDEAVIGDLKGRSAIGHVRYSTTGSSVLGNAQPLLVQSRRGSLAIAHNGNLVNAHELRERLEQEGAIFTTTVDTEVMAHLIARHRKAGLEEAIVHMLGEVRGAYALLFLTEDKLIGVRDPHGIRPLSLGKLNGSWVLASESCAFDTVGADYVRDVAPGEMVVISGDTVRSTQAVPSQAPQQPRLCVFEYIYFSRPDTDLQGRNVHASRKEMGRQLAREAPVAADVVIGVPDSSISAATGYAEESGIPYEMGLIKNRYIGRTFISPDQEGRRRGVRLKLNALKKVLEGKRVVLVDDSVVRGTTSRHLVNLLREAGAREVHMRISSPPYRFGCHYGIDTGDTAQLVAVGRSMEQIRDLVGADSLYYLSLEGMVKAIGTGVATGDFCHACFTGDYPEPIPEGAGKFAFEKGGS